MWVNFLPRLKSNTPHNLHVYNNFYIPEIVYEFSLQYIETQKET